MTDEVRRDDDAESGALQSDRTASLLSLPVITNAGHAAAQVPVRSRWAIPVHFLRVLGVLLLVILSRPAQRHIESSGPPAIESVRNVFPNAARIEVSDNAAAVWRVLASDGTVIGRVARTMPQAAQSRGYRGPTEALLVINEDDRIESVTVLESLDTAEHVQAVRDDSEFLSQFRGWKLSAPETEAQVDGVAGATLTSLALAEGVLSRLGVVGGSLVFPEPLTVDEAIGFAKRAFADNRELIAELSTGDSVSILSPKRELVGRLYRTGLASDALVGYQGPSEMRIAVSLDGVIAAIEIRRSFDNEPYVEYIRTDRYFWRTFKGKTIKSIAEFDPLAAGVEGVSAQR